MRKVILIFVFIFSTILAFAEDESVKPTRGVTLERKLFGADIEDELHLNVIVELKAADGVWTDGVKVIVTNSETGGIIYKKTIQEIISLCVFGWNNRSWQGKCSYPTHNIQERW